MSGSIGAHVASWLLHFGRLPRPGNHICHECDELYPIGDISYRRCVNPSHLFEDTARGNALDMVAKRRHNFGERNGHHKLTELEVLAIRANHPTLEDAQVAAMYGVCQATVSHVRTGRNWRHLPLHP